VVTEYRPLEMATVSERSHRNALEFRTTREVNSQEGRAHAEGLLIPPPNRSELGAPQGELDGTIGKALVLQSPLQRPRTKLIFDVFFDHPFLD